jgi:hypothetical protein
VSPVQLFLGALYHLLHSFCMVETGQAPGPLSIAYGGNCWDATTYAHAIGGLLIPWPVSG